MPAALNLSLSDLPSFFDAKADALSNLDLSAPLRVIGQLLIADTREFFQSSTGPDGEAWLPLRHPSKKRGGASAKPLLDTGILRASVTAQGSGGVYEISTHSLILGSRVPYAAYQQFGTKRIPARPFLGWTSRTLARADQILADHVANALASS